VALGGRDVFAGLGLFAGSGLAAASALFVGALALLFGSGVTGTAFSFGAPAPLAAGFAGFVAGVSSWVATTLLALARVFGSLFGSVVLFSVLAIFGVRSIRFGGFRPEASKSRQAGTGR